MPNQGFLDIVVKLVQLGGLGFGALIFLFVFILLLRGQPVDKRTADLQKRFLTLGVSFAITALALSLAQGWLMRPEPGPTSVALVTTFAHDFAADGLPAPAMMILGSSTPVIPDQPVAISGNATLRIRIDPLIQAAKDLPDVQSTAKDLAAANQQLVTKLSKGHPAMSNTKSASNDVSSSIKNGDWKRASRAAASLRVGVPRLPF